MAKNVLESGVFVKVGVLPIRWYTGGVEPNAFFPKSEVPDWSEGGLVLPVDVATMARALG
jgi:hypothetical protein